METSKTKGRLQLGGALVLGGLIVGSLAEAPSRPSAEPRTQNEQQGNQVAAGSSRTRVAPPSSVRALRATREAQARAAGIPVGAPAGEAGQLTIERSGSDGQGLEAAAREVLVSLKPGLGPTEAAQIARQLGTRILSYSPLSNLYRFAAPEGQSLLASSEQVAALPGVAEARPNYIVRATSCDPEVATVADPQWYLNHLETDVVCADGVPTGMAAVRVAVVDTGIAYESATRNSVAFTQAPGLSGTPFVVPEGADVFNNDAWPNDDHRHGTHLASLITSNASYKGISPDLTLVPIKVLDSSAAGTEATLVEGLLVAAEAEVDVVNLSLSFELGYWPSFALQDAILQVKRSGAVMVGSTGNQGLQDISYPGAFPDVIAVGATELARNGNGAGCGNKSYFDGLALYGNHSTLMDVVAPGGNVTNNLNCDSKLDAVYAETLLTPGTDLSSFGNVGYSGTSQAAALVSAQLAWARAVDPSLTADEARAALLEGANDHVDLNYSGAGFDSFSGAGLVNMTGLVDSVELGAVSIRETYVNILPAIYVDGSEQKGVAWVQVLGKNADGSITPMAGVKVWGRWGGYSYEEVSAITNGSGLAWFESSEVPVLTAESEPVKAFFGLMITAVAESSGSMARISRPMSFYNASSGLARSLELLLSDVTSGTETLDTSNAALLMVADPASTSLSSLFDLSKLKKSYIYRPVGAGTMTAPLASAYSGEVLAELDQALDPSPFTLALGGTYQFGWGSATSVGGTYVETTCDVLPDVESFTLLPLDPSILGQGSTPTQRVLNAHWDQYAGEQAAFSPGFASTSLANGFAMSLTGTGYAMSLTGTGYAMSLTGTGYAMSLTGTGYAMSLWGTAYAMSLTGTGYAMSLTGTGYAMSLTGTAYAMSLTGTGLAIAANSEEDVTETGAGSCGGEACVAADE